MSERNTPPAHQPEISPSLFISYELSAFDKETQEKIKAIIADLLELGNALLNPQRKPSSATKDFKDLLEPGHGYTVLLTEKPEKTSAQGTTKTPKGSPVLQVGVIRSEEDPNMLEITLSASREGASLDAQRSPIATILTPTISASNLLQDEALTLIIHLLNLRTLKLAPESGFPPCVEVIIHTSTEVPNAQASSQIQLDQETVSYLQTVFETLSTLTQTACNLARQKYKTDQIA